VTILHDFLLNYPTSLESLQIMSWSTKGLTDQDNFKYEMPFLLEVSQQSQQRRGATITVYGTI